MPKIGDIKYGRELHYKSLSTKYIWHACIDCGKGRWVVIITNRPVRLKCRSCSKKGKYHPSGDESPNWKGGKYLTHGYVRILLRPDNFFYSMADTDGYVLEHRLVMAKHLGRCLQDWEKVHHKGMRHTGIENKQDNLEDNLEMSSSLGEHSANHSKGYKDGYAKGLIDGRNKQILNLKEELRILRQQIQWGED